MVKSHMENLGTTQEKAARRPEVDKVKNLLRVPFKEKLHENPDFPSMDTGIKDVIRGFGLQGVETVDDLLNRTEAPGYNPAIAREKLVTLSTAVYEVMMEEKLEEVIVAGSFTTEKYLPSELVGQDRNNPEGSRFALMVVQNYIDKFGTEEKRAEISSTLEYIDYIKNSEYNKGSFLEEQADEAYVALKKIKPNLMNKEEMDAYVKAVEYVSRLKTNVVASDSFDPGRPSAEEIRAARERAQNIPPRMPGGEEGADQAEFTYDMTRDRFVEMEYNMQSIRWYDERPPKWYDKDRMSEDDREIIDLRLRILNAAANKIYFRNKDIEKLRNNYPEITEHDFGLLWEKMPGFKEATISIVQDLCEEYVDPDGRKLLRLKTNGLNVDGQKKRDENGHVLEPNAIDPSVKYKLEHFFKYKKDFASGLNVEGLTEQQKTEAVSTAWNFLYVGDSVESWDYFRELKPTVCVSDKLRTMDHPMIKALGKWGVWKGYQNPNEVVAGEGQEEPFVSGPLSAWILDRLNYEPGFKNRLISGDLKDMLPRTMVVSMIESTAIGSGGERTSLATALLNNRVDLISRHFRNGSDKNLMQPHNDMVQGGEFILNLIKGKIPYVAGKNSSQFVSDFVENTSLIRQEPNIPTVGGRLNSMAFVDKPEFFAWALTIATGFNPYDKTPLPDASAFGGDYKVYDLRMKDLVARVTQRSSVDKKTVLKLLAADGIVSVKKRQLENRVQNMNRKDII